jgi:hypothetical protein
MSRAPQSFDNHRRWSPLYHFVALPISWLYFGFRLVQAILEPTNGRVVTAAFALAVACGILAARVMAVTLQNRVIRLEMRLRLREILPPPLGERIKELTVRQLIALRFASDAELPGLVERTLKGEFPTRRAIKRAITDWQPDHYRV